MQHIQRPTCVNVRIRSTQDAHKIFYAVQRGILQMVTRRLDADERLALRSGCIYAWEERGPHTEITGLGIERFTEGRRWSPSRVRDEFLFYYEKYSPTTDGNQRASDSKVPPRDWDPLVKQTYSVYVDTTKGRRKWHLTAYFTQATVDQLGTVDDIDGVGNLDVPDGLFKSTRVGKGRKNDEASGRVGESSTAAASATRTPPGSQSLHMYQPYPNAHYPSSYYAPSEYSPAASPHQRAPPPLSSAPSYVNESSTRLPSAAPTSHYEYNRPPTLSNRAWSPPPPISAPRNADSPFYGSAAPSPAPYSPATSYRSPPPSHSSHVPPQQHSSRHSNASSHSHSPPPNWSDEGINRYPSAEVQRADLRPSMPQRPYDSPYTYVPPAPPSVNVSISRPRSPQYPSPTTHTHTHSSHTQNHTPYSVPHIPPLVNHHNNHPHNNNHHNNPTHTHTYNNDRMDDSYEPSSPTSSMDSDERRGANGPCRRVDLAPLYALQRSHPYRRDPVDDRTLRLLGPRSS